jgi:hypothetical protein
VWPVVRSTEAVLTEPIEVTMSPADFEEVATMIRVLAAITAFALASFLSLRLVKAMSSGNRDIEWTANEQSGALSETSIHWTIVHIRDDIGSIVGLIIVTNGLLAAILGAHLF